MLEKVDLDLASLCGMFTATRSVSLEEMDRAFGIARSDIVMLLERLSAHAAVSLQNPVAFAAGLEALRDGEWVELKLGRHRRRA